MLTSLMIAAVLTAQGAPAAAAATAAPAAQAQAQAAKPEPPKKVCVTEAQLGSHFKKKICATPEEWERRRLRDEAEVSKMGERTAACSGSSC